ncbi:MAG: amidohydrolase [Firmicutes bacterium]|nr:amidohydrolase [Bacillota bacterium]
MTILHKQLLKQQVCTAIKEHAVEIIALANSIANQPELGFKEHNTANKIAKIFNQYNIPYTTGHAITGVKGRLSGKTSTRNIAVLGEMDAVTCFEHPLADGNTGAAHACGHHAQVAAMVGCGIGLITAGIMEHLDGDVTLFAVPAEEYVEIEYRNQLREQGIIGYLSGKSELIRQGAFDDIDMAMMIHLSTEGEAERTIQIGGTSNGFIGKMIKYTGKEAHAAGAPHEGVNALNAAMIAMMAVNAQRETFKDEDYVRFHPIITKGGDLVNIVPAEVRMESYVRARTLDAMIDANKKVNRALQAGADAVGAQVEINDLPGFMPMINNPEMSQLFSNNATELLSEQSIKQLHHHAASTDMGDLAHIMPVIHPWIGGVKGNAHTRDFTVSDPEMVYIISAQCMAMTVIDLLTDNASQAEAVLNSHTAKMTKKEYISFMDSISKK